MENLTKSILILLGPILFGATEVAAQYASPYFNPAIFIQGEQRRTHQFYLNNPATIAWREKSSVSLGTGASTIKDSISSHPNGTITKNFGLFSVSGYLKPRVKTGFDLGVHQETTKFIGSVDGAERGPYYVGSAEKHLLSSQIANII